MLAGNDAAGAAAWIRTLGGVPAPEELAHRWADSLTAAHLEVPIGVSAEADFTIGDEPETVWLNLAAANGGARPHFAYAGRTGMGNSYALNGLLTGLAARYSPDRVQFVLAEYRGMSLCDTFAKFPHTAITAPDLRSDSDGVTALFDTLHAEIDRRVKLLGERGASDLEHYNAQPSAADTPRMPALLITIDEIDPLLAEHPDAVTSLLRVVRVGRSLGMHLLLAGQRAPQRLADAWPHITGRVCLSVHSKFDSIAMISTTDAAVQQLRPGWAYLRTTGLDMPAPFRVFDIGSPAAHELRNLIESMPKPQWRIAETTPHLFVGEQVTVDFGGTAVAGTYAGRRGQLYVVRDGQPSGGEIVTAQLPHRVADATA
ncbi:FtsK/SpoIIIE domain-containing protein [Mycolicibacterium aubagnense]|uniref:FtsK/SpoIIIE domain-containing protein n=1 Tax=Mycolicibacterium aubagnense TaxID=319707 RepID=UPI0014770B3D|nr:FtsK/SpoIIIE domain-containing protein [Mycolicibacterium aubagnense]